jgi:hypothetical protein
LTLRIYVGREVPHTALVKSWVRKLSHSYVHLAPKLLTQDVNSTQTYVRLLCQLRRSEELILKNWAVAVENVVATKLAPVSRQSMQKVSPISGNTPFLNGEMAIWLVKTPCIIPLDRSFVLRGTVSFFGYKIVSESDIKAQVHTLLT